MARTGGIGGLLLILCVTDVSMHMWCAVKEMGDLQIIVRDYVATLLSYWYLVSTGSCIYLDTSFYGRNSNARVNLEIQVSSDQSGI